MWFQLKVLFVLFVICTLISWCAPAAGSGGPLRESAWRALEGSIRDLAEYRCNDDEDEDAEPPATTHRRVNSAPRPSTTTASRKRISAHTMKEVGASRGWRCAICKETLRSDFQVDHIIPLHRRLALGQPLDNDIAGLQPVCTVCHLRKSHREQSRRTSSRSAGASA